MTTRDLYAAGTGLFIGLTVQAIGVYLARPTPWFALLLLTLLGLLVATVVMHVTCIVSEAVSALKRSQATTSAAGATSARLVRPRQLVETDEPARRDQLDATPHRSRARPAATHAVVEAPAPAATAVQ